MKGNKESSPSRHVSEDPSRVDLSKPLGIDKGPSLTSAEQIFFDDMHQGLNNILKSNEQDLTLARALTEKGLLTELQALSHPTSNYVSFLKK